MLKFMTEIISFIYRLFCSFQKFEKALNDRGSWERRDKRQCTYITVEMKHVTV